MRDNNNVALYSSDILLSIQNVTNFHVYQALQNHRDVVRDAVSEDEKTLQKFYKKIFPGCRFGLRTFIIAFSIAQISTLNFKCLDFFFAKSFVAAILLEIKTKLIQLVFPDCTL